MKFLGFLLAGVAAGAVAAGALAGDLEPRVEVEEDVYSYTPANNGAGPMWCHGSACLARAGEEVLASGLETLPEAKPLNNCVPLLFARREKGWVQVARDPRRTREPSPLAVFHDGRVFLSVNPTLAGPEAHAGPARPEILEFRPGALEAPPVAHLPRWQGEPPFTEHSYRSLSADGERGELILFQNIGYTHAEWSFRDREGRWSAQGRLTWPWGAEYDTPQPIRVCYPAVALRDRAVHFAGVSDIQEPYKRWRDFKRQLTGREWDYDFRRLFYTWSDDIRSGRFHDWVEVSSRDRTCGWIFPMDLWVAPGGEVFVLWTERAIDERLREKFFPEEKQRHSLEVAILREGRVRLRRALVEGGEGLGGERPGDGRFHVTPEGRLFVVYYVGGRDEGGRELAENRVVEVFPDGGHRKPVALKLEKPLSSFFTATARAGCRPSRRVDLLGDRGGTMRYVRLRLW